MFKWKKKSVQAVTKVKQGKPIRIQNIDHIKKWEGLRLNAYLPTPQDKWTIGYGHTKTVHRGMVITEARAEELLRGDIAWVEAAIEKWVKVPLTQNQYDALGGLIYNIVEGAFMRSTLLKKLNTKDYQGAADEFLRWNKQKGKVLQGLVNRRKDERELFLRPLYCPYHQSIH
jgi:GH24 family phage-related lysozyme (muramidase)